MTGNQRDFLLTMRSLRLAGLVVLVAVIYCTGARAAPAPCAPSDLQIASGAQSDAKGTLQAVVNFIKGNDQNTKALLLRWFGRNEGAIATKVSDIFRRSAQWMNTVTFYCLYENDGSNTADVVTPAGTIRVDVSGGLFAYVNRNDLSKVYLGLKFFTAPASTGYDSRLGTLIHEMTHFWITGNTNRSSSEVYLKAECLKLAQTDPAGAQANAQSYEYFVEEWLKQ
jgi:Lysine-specific metallo-endopeptidase